MKSHTHCVHFYQADIRAFVRSVGRYLLDGLSQCDVVFMIATGAHRELLCRELRRLGVDPDAKIRDRELISLDSERLLSRYLVDGKLDRGRFEAAVEPVTVQMKTRSVRVYVDTVGVLWKAGRRAAALQLEDFWHHLLSENEFQLHCGYPIDVFRPEFNSLEVRQILAAHTQLVPTGAIGDLSEALDQAISDLDLDIPADIEPSIRGSAIPPAEDRILSLWEHSDRAEEILDRARGYYRQDQRFRSLVEHLYDAIALIDSNAVISFASASTLRVLGYEARELRGIVAFDLLHPADQPQARQTLQAAAREPGVPIQTRARVRHKDGRWIWAELSITNLLLQEEVLAIVINYRDISAQVAAEAANRRLSNQLSQSRQEHLQIATAVAGDVMNSVRKIRSFGRLLSEHAIDPAGGEMVRHIQENAKAASDLLSDLILLMSLEPGQPSASIPLSRPVAQSMAKLEPLISATGAVIEVGTLPEAQVNESQFSALFEHLIENSIKFRGPEAPRIAISSQRLGEDWIVKVEDNGIGVDENYREFIFGVFARMPNAGIPGRGTGLALCKKIVELAGGKIWVDSNPTGGSIFCVAIPSRETN